MRKGGLSVLVFLALVCFACDGGDEEPSWECYAHSDTGACECFGGKDTEYGGTNVERVEVCEGYEACFSYMDKLFDEPRCGCGDADYMPESGATEVEPVEKCPDE